jgi:molecular chaperone DnaJ
VAAQRDWLDKDFYKVLGVSKSADEKEIVRAYRKLAKKYHPDANPGDKKAEDKFKDATNAYDVLADPAKRKEYDDLRAMGAAGFGVGRGAPGGNPFGGSGQAAGPGGAGFRFEDIGDLFGGLFNRGGRSSRGPQRGEDLEAELRMSFEDAVNGVTTTINIASDASCESCHGAGAQPGTSSIVCPACGGRGSLEENQGVFSFSHPCSHCGGSGRKIEHPCKTCKGSGVQRRNRQVKVRIPSGVSDGQRIRLKERGGAGRNGAPSGDLFVIVKVAPHDRFGRKGNDLTVKVPVTYPELVFGTIVRAPTLKGTVSLRVQPGTRPGATLRARGQGVTSGDKTGDLLVTLDLIVPNQPTDAEKEAIQALADVTDVGERLRSKWGDQK